MPPKARESRLTRSSSRDFTWFFFRPPSPRSVRTKTPPPQSKSPPPQTKSSSPPQSKSSSPPQSKSSSPPPVKKPPPPSSNRVPESYRNKRSPPSSATAGTPGKPLMPASDGRVASRARGKTSAGTRESTSQKKSRQKSAGSKTARPWSDWYLGEDGAYYWRARVLRKGGWDYQFSAAYEESTPAQESVHGTQDSMLEGTHESTHESTQEYAQYIPEHTQEYVLHHDPQNSNRPATTSTPLPIIPEITLNPAPDEDPPNEDPPSTPPSSPSSENAPSNHHLHPSPNLSPTPSFIQSLSSPKSSWPTILTTSTGHPTEGLSVSSGRTLTTILQEVEEEDEDLEDGKEMGDIPPGNSAKTPFVMSGGNGSGPGPSPNSGPGLNSDNAEPEPGSVERSQQHQGNQSTSGSKKSGPSKRPMGPVMRLIMESRARKAQAKAAAVAAAEAAAVVEAVRMEGIVMGEGEGGAGGVVGDGVYVTEEGGFMGYPGGVDDVNANNNTNYGVEIGAEAGGAHLGAPNLGPGTDFNPGNPLGSPPGNNTGNTPGKPPAAKGKTPGKPPAKSKAQVAMAKKLHAKVRSEKAMRVDTKTRVKTWLKKVEVDWTPIALDEQGFPIY
ncbi:hypothetical protein B0J18DRAFT_476956 [Chaetomium sp. MPI-SDFR-AT-0129]|nr:hypothetical protein B0J18DRAFT_476956 [Chaetomium sp. MPI-SDFR-AT-0129]